jgi:hypothetical protein
LQYLLEAPAGALGHCTRSLNEIAGHLKGNGLCHGITPTLACDVDGIAVIGSMSTSADGHNSPGSI